MTDADVQIRQTEGAPLLRVRALTKAFPGVMALSGVDFDLREGEVHAMLGKNGAGKSTLISILSGNEKADAGEVEYRGEAMDLRDLSAINVATVFQESTVFPHLSIEQNIFAGDEPVGRAKTVDFASVREKVKQSLTLFGIDADPEEPVELLRPAERKVIEIIRGFQQDRSVLILDEPTAALSQHETDRLIAHIKQAKHAGLAIIYITHRLEEIFRIADRITVLRDGRVVLSAPASELDVNDIVREIVGSEDLASGKKDKRENAPASATTRPRLRIAQLDHDRGRFSQVDLTVGAGEIVGIAGLVGAGKTELARALFGAETVASGSIELDGRIIAPKSPAEAIAAGIVYVTEDRKGDGLFLDMSIAENLFAPLSADSRRGGRLFRAAEMTRQAKLKADLFNVKHHSVEQTVSTLSGGNQQKVMVARSAQLDPRVLIVDEPTVGVDVGARKELFRLLWASAARGVSIILISSEVGELLENVDRIVTMREGRVTGSFRSAATDEQTIVSEIAGAGNIRT